MYRGNAVQDALMEITRSNRSFLDCRSFRSVKNANGWHSAMHQGSNMLDFSESTRELRRQHGKGKDHGKDGCSVIYSLTPQILPGLPLARLKNMADRWTLPLTCGWLPVHIHSRRETCSTAARPIYSRELVPCAEAAAKGRTLFTI